MAAFMLSWHVSFRIHRSNSRHTVLYPPSTSSPPPNPPKNLTRRRANLEHIPIRQANPRPPHAPPSPLRNLLPIPQKPPIRNRRIIKIFIDLNRRNAMHEIDIRAPSRDEQRSRLLEDARGKSVFATTAVIWSWQDVQHQTGAERHSCDDGGVGAAVFVRHYALACAVLVD